jgi:hypothetical protein
MIEGMKSQFRLFLAGSGEKRISQPVGFCLPGSLDGTTHKSRFLWRQSHGKDGSRDAFCREPGTAHFLFHKKVYFRLRKCLTIYLSFVYKSLVSNFETRSCWKNARTPSARLASQRHPARTGAGIERLAMKARLLKIEKTGDFCYGKIIPRIRIAGQWLEQAGFKPGHRVEIHVEQPGNLTLRFLEQPEEVAL